MALREIRMKEKIELVRLVGKKKRIAPTLKGVFEHWQGERERLLFLCAHDDDIVTGAGLLIQLAVRENIPVHIVVATDGSMGYCSMEEKETISETRRSETFECYQMLGVPKENIIWLGFPDCQLSLYCGRRPASSSDRAVIQGYTGLQNAFTFCLRKICPTQCFVPTSSDLHPDHRIVHEELLISLYHSTGSIWPELGTPLEKTPCLHEFACYCNYPQPPQLRIQVPTSLFEKKLNALGAFRSQKQIDATVNNLKKSGPVEYIREMEFKLYDPSEYKDLFE